MNASRDGWGLHGFLILLRAVVVFGLTCAAGGQPFWLLDDVWVDWLGEQSTFLAFFEPLA